MDAIYNFMVVLVFF